MQKTTKHAPRAEAAAIALAALAPWAAYGAPLDLEAWVAASLESLPNSPTYRALDAERQSAEAFIQAAESQSPWTLSTMATHGQSFPRDMEGAGLEVTTAVEYRRRSGWVGTLAGSVSLLEVPVAERVEAPFSVDLTLAYDLVGGGADSAANDRAAAAALRGVGGAISAESLRLEASLGFIDGVSAVFAARCKMKRVVDLRKVVTAAVAGAQIQLDAKVLSQADFLNFRFLDDSFAARLANADAESRAAFERLAAWGPEVLAAVGALREVDCDSGPARATAHAQASQMTPEAIAQLARRLPTPVARRADRLSAAFDARATSTELLPVLSPFAGGRFGRRLGVDQETVTALVGLSFDWNIPQARGDASRTAAQYAATAASLRAEESVAAAEARIRGLLARIESERQTLEILVRSTASTDQLVRVLEVQRAIGDVDALNQANALLNAVDLKLAVVDSFVRLITAQLQLRGLQGAAELANGPYEAALQRELP